MCTRVAPTSKASRVLATCSEGRIGTAGLSFLRGTDPVIATAMTTGFIAWVLTCGSYIEEDGFILALEANVEGIDGQSVLLAPGGDQGRHPPLVLDARQHRAFRIGGLLVAEIHARVEADIDAPRHDPERDVRSHGPPVPVGRAARLDGLEAILARGPIRGLAAPADEMRIGLAARFLGAV